MNIKLYSTAIKSVNLDSKTGILSVEYQKGNKIYWYLVQHNYIQYIKHQLLNLDDVSIGNAISFILSSSKITKLEPTDLMDITNITIL